MPLKLVLLLILAGVVAGYFYVRSGELAKRSLDARAAVAQGALLVDVRTPGEFAAGHLPGAINIPVGELESRLSELGAKDGGLVLYCRSGARSAGAKRLLEEAGFSRVLDLGPKHAW